uniref:Portal vertex protein of head n=1 Tax=Pseudomonas phage Cygsa01 TaxID=3138529 RepID=A0AAU6W410_9VIRU
MPPSLKDFNPLGTGGNLLRAAVRKYGDSLPPDERIQVRNQELTKGKEQGVQSINAFGFGTTALPLGVVDFTDTKELIGEYRSMVVQEATVDYAVDDIVNEVISTDEDEDPIAIDLSAVEGMSDAVKGKIEDRWSHICTLLDLNDNAYERFKEWYVDGRAAYHLVWNSDTPKAKRSIQKIEMLDPRYVKKVLKNAVQSDRTTGLNQVTETKAVYAYNPSEENSNSGTSYSPMYNFSGRTYAEIAPDNMVFFHSGIISADGTRILGPLEKARKPLNNLKMVKDSLVIYRLTNSTEKRVFYIDCGDMGKTAAEEHVKKLMNRYRNRLSYDPATGKVKGSSGRMTMIEDFWIPRNADGKGTQVDTLQAGQNLGEMDDVLYFQKELYRSLNIPVSRLNEEGGLIGGRMAEITRDEWKFSKFINRLRRRFSSGLVEILHREVIGQRIMTEAEWKLVEPNISLVYASDSYVREQREAEALNEKLQALDVADRYVGKYFSKMFVLKQILRFTEDEVKLEKKVMEKEKAAGEYDPPEGVLDAEGNLIPRTPASALDTASDDVNYFGPGDE